MDNKYKRKPSHSERHAQLMELLMAGAALEEARLHADHVGHAEIERRYGNGKGGGYEE